jgi:hypothetical protein
MDFLSLGHLANTPIPKFGGNGLLREAEQCELS